MNKRLNKFITFFLILQPVLDVITSIQIRNEIGFLSISAIIRGLFLIFIIIYLYKNKINTKYIFLFTLYVFLAMSYYFFYTKNNLIVEIMNIIKIFYLPFLIYFFTNINNKNINDKLITIIYLIYLNLIIIPYIFGFGFNVYKPFENKGGYIGLFYGGNEVSAIILGLMPIVFDYIINAKNYILKILILIETILVITLIGTKTLYLGFIIVLFYLIFKYKNKINKKYILLFLLLIIFTIIIFPKLNVSKNLKVALDFYKVEKVNDLFEKNNIDNIIFSKRLTYLSNTNKLFINSNNMSLLYGIGLDSFKRVIEIDIFDLFYSIGIFGFITYILMLIFQKLKLNNKYLFSLILFIIISLLSGHVLLEPMVSIYLALLFILNKQEKSDKKRILLVSNMYPSKKYKFFGSFIKNTENLLKENNFEVDKVVKYKEVTKLNKIISYIIFYTKSFLKVIFNNYDFIYVHFPSHSTKGILIPFKTSKNTKLIINVHGNDVVADYDFEKKNIKRSKKYLPLADKIIVPSNYYKKVINENYKVSLDKIFVYPSGGVDTSKFKKIDKKEAKEKSGLKEEYEYIGYISRIEKNKGYDVFLEAIKELEKEDKIDNKKFLIIGTGDEEKIMRNIIKDLDLTKYLEIRNMVSQEDLINIYNSLEIFVFPTYRESESLGLVGLEAMACETFLIAANNYGPTDYVIDNKNGFLFSPKNEIDLKNKILDYYKLNNEQKKKIYKKERETALKYDTTNTKDLILKVFN